MRNAGLEETQAGIKIARININNLRYADGNSLLLFFNQKGTEWMLNISGTYKFCTSYNKKNAMIMEI